MLKVVCFSHTTKVSPTFTINKSDNFNDSWGPISIIWQTDIFYAQRVSKVNQYLSTGKLFDCPSLPFKFSLSRSSPKKFFRGKWKYFFLWLTNCKCKQCSFLQKSKLFEHFPHGTYGRKKKVIFFSGTVTQA